MAKLKKIINKDGTHVIDCGADKLKRYKVRGEVDTEFMMYYTSGLYDYVEYEGKYLLVPKEYRR